MSRLIARILLSIFIFPLASLIYLIAFLTYVENVRYRPYRDEIAFIFAGLLTWGFIALYWWLLWRSSVRWTNERSALTVGAVLVASIAGAIAGAATTGIDNEFGCFIGSVTAPLLWLVATVFLWRESTSERGARLNQNKNTLVCPTCGYNLTGLQTPRCPECGTQFTLDQLIAQQPWNTGAELNE
jgi:hypothetical protein